jgi:hypothetical protein
MGWQIINQDSDNINILALPTEDAVAPNVDQVPFYDASAGGNRKTAVTNLFPAGSITGDKLVNGALSADTLGRAKMADGFVSTGKLADGALSADALGRAKMADGFVAGEKLTGIQSGAAPVFGIRAWVCYNGISNTIKASGNVSSVTKNGTGDYTINFATALPDGNYAVANCTTGYATSTGITNVCVYPTGTLTFLPATKTATACRVIAGYTHTTAAVDIGDIGLIFIR